MSTQIGRFEILSEIAKSVRGGVFKANDPTSNQTVALKTVCLDIPEDQAKEFVERVLAEGEHTRELNSQNLALLYGAGQIEDQFCAAMEYVQGNSIATMLARHEGFSIWDLLDISRQVCAGLDHASSIGVVHHSLEPAKIMVQWDGLVKILGYGISTMSLLDTEPEGVPSPVLHYMSPEQVGGGATDGRSNLFTWGAILYEMVTDQPAFDGTTTDVVFHNILNENPVPPSQINNKIHPAVSELIMKALAKNPDERYQSGREMLDDLEKCKESTGKSATKKSEPARTANAPAGARAAAASKFAGAVAQLRQNQPLRREPSQLRNLRHPHQLNRYLKFFMWRLLRLRRKATPRKPQILSQASRQNKFQARRHTMRTQRYRMIFMRTHLERKWLSRPRRLPRLLLDGTAAWFTRSPRLQDRHRSKTPASNSSARS